MNLQVPITISDEMTDEVIEATGLLDLASGEIRRVEYTEYDVKAGGIPAHRKDYEFTSGTLSSQGKDVEFGVHVHPVTGEYSVTADELQEIKTRAAALFAGAARQE